MNLLMAVGMSGGSSKVHLAGSDPLALLLFISGAISLAIAWTLVTRSAPTRPTRLD